MKRLYHIYYNTSGNSGLYLNPITDSLSCEYEQKCFVNYYYPIYKNGYTNIFFKYTEKNENNKYIRYLRIPIIRKIVRFIELALGNNKMLRIISKDRPDIINYSLTNMPDAYYLLKKIKRILPNCILIVTCHDVMPNAATSKIPYTRIYNLSDYLLVHNIESKRQLMTVFGLPENKIILHPFPLIDLKLLDRDEIERTNQYPHFLQVGVMRKEKGVQILTKAWKKIGKNICAELIIAGFKPQEVSIDFNEIIEYTNTKIIEKTLSDEEYIKLIKWADYVIFPYQQVGNSGVLSTIVSMHKVPITSKLDVFLKSRFVNDKLTFETGDSDDLANLIERVVRNHDKTYKNYQKQVVDALADQDKSFSNDVLSAYRGITQIDRKE